MSVNFITEKRLFEDIYSGVNNLNGCVSIRKIEFVIKILPPKNHSGPDGEFY